MHCPNHNIDYHCPACRAEEEAESRRRMLDLEIQAKAELEAQRRFIQLLKLESDEIDQRQNRGLYDCPFCLYRKLERGASRCPACHTEITQDQWHPILEIERGHAKEWARGEPERQRHAQEAKQLVEAKRTTELDAARDWKIWVCVYYGYLLPILTLLSNATIYWFVSGRFSDPLDRWNLVVSLLMLMEPLGCFCSARSYGVRNHPGYCASFWHWAWLAVSMLGLQSLRRLDYRACVEICDSARSFI